MIEIHGKKVKGVGLGNIFSAGPIKLRSAGSKEQPLAEKRAPTSPKGQAPKEPVAQENMEKVCLLCFSTTASGTIWERLAVCMSSWGLTLKIFPPFIRVGGANMDT